MFSQTVIPAGVEHTVLKATALLDSVPPELLEDDGGVEVVVDLCYCSVYGECWRSNSEEDWPVRVDGCEGVPTP